MPTFPSTIEFNLFGGGNWNDEGDALMRRSHQQVEGGFRQVNPVEASDLRNIDFIERAMGKRKGSAASDDLTSVLVASETLIGEAIEFNGNQIQVGVKSIYTNQSGSWAQINDSASAAYTHAADVSKCTLLALDGHLFIGLDGANKIQVWRSGADLDPAMDNGNLYTESKGGGTQTITGTWGTGYYILLGFHGRLCFGNGDSILEYTDVAEPWDLAGGSFWQAKSNIVAAKTFVPRGGNEIQEFGFMFTTDGAQILSGFDLTDSVKSVEGAGVPINHRCVVATRDWLMYPTRTQGIEAINLFRIIDVGRRFLNGDGVTGPLDLLEPTNANMDTLPFGYYDARRKQAIWYAPDGSRSTNSMALGLDFQLGEPGVNELEQNAELHVRPLFHIIKEPANNAWFVGAYQILGGIRGTMANGKTYTINSGLNDLGTLPIEEYWDTPEITAGMPDWGKTWLRNAIRTEKKGSWPLYVEGAINRSSTFLPLWNFDQVEPDDAVYGTAVYGTAVYASGGNVRVADWINLYSESLRLRLSNQATSQDWVVNHIGIEYQFGERGG
jgi:hypothetical protein